MFLAQASRTPGLRIVGIADLDLAGLSVRLPSLGIGAQDTAATARAPSGKAIWLTEDAEALIAHADVEIVVEATGNPQAAIRHAQLATAHGRHIVMASVEADALAGPLLARQSAAAGCLYSLAYGDQPALICELVDWARACGFEIVAAGKGTKYLPAYHLSTPDTIWDHYGISAEQAKAAGMNARMFNSFLDGTKSAVEMAAVANACDLEVPDSGLAFPPCSAGELAARLQPTEKGGVLERAGQVEVVSSLHRDGRPVENDLRWGVYVVYAAGEGRAGDYAANCFAEYGMTRSPDGRCAALYRPYHLIGMELTPSLAAIGLRGEASGCPRAFRGDVVSVAKSDLAAGTRLDGEGGACLWGKLLPARRSLSMKAVPIGLAENLCLKAPLMRGEVLTWDAVEAPADSPALSLRREMEKLFLLDR
jgi:predicted homoserine dehydrogenase-like protein